MQKWEYFALECSFESGPFAGGRTGKDVMDDQGLSDCLKEMGEMGWELVGVHPRSEGQYANYIFKRPMER